MITIRHILPIITFLAAMLFCAMPVNAAQKRALLISSYHPGFPTFFQQIDGLKSVLGPENISLDVEFMDSKRFFNAESLSRFHNLLKSKLAAVEPYDVIFTSDDNALVYALEHREELFPGVPLIFFGVNDQERARSLETTRGITGVIESVSMRETLELIGQLLPESQAIYAITDATPSGQGDLNTFKELAANFPEKTFEVLSLSDMTWAEFSARLEKIHPNDVLLLLSAYRDKEDHEKLFEQSLELILSHASIPVFHLWKHGVGDGVLGGKVISHYVQGVIAGELGIQVLGGTPIEDVPLVEGDAANRHVMDYSVLKRFRISEDVAPESVTWVNKPSSLFTEYWREAVAALIFLAFLTLAVVALAVTNVRLRLARKALNISEERMSMALDAVNDAVWDWNPQTGETFFNSGWYSMLGYAPDDLKPSFETWKQLVHPEDLDMATEAISHYLETSEKYDVELRMQAKNGKWHWINTRGKIVARDASGAALRMVGTNLDITKRKTLEDQLTTAKEDAEEANRALRVNMAHLRTLIDTMPELVWLKDVNGVYIFCSERFGRFFGVPEADIIGKTDYDFVEKELADFFREHDRFAMEAGEPTVNEETITFKDDGHAEELETIKTPMYDDQGKLIGVLGVGRDMTERNQIARELKDSELRFKALHNASFGGIAIHDKGIILDCNQGLAEISGYSIDELVGMDGLLLVAESFRKMVLAQIQAGYKKPYEAMGLRKNGEEYPIRLEARNLPYKGQQVRAVEFRDITSRKKAEEKLKDSDLRHRVIFENSPLGMVRYGQDGNILDCNGHFVELMGVSRERLIGFNALTQSNELMREALRKAIEGQPSAYEDYYTSVTGNKTIFLRAQFNPVDQGTIPTEVIATLEDYSDRKESQDKLKHAKDEAEKANYAKSMFLANMSHELRTPLNGIMGMQQLLKSTSLDSEQDEYVTLAIQSAQRLTGLLSDILDLTKIESGKMSIAEKSLDLPEVFDLVKQLFGPSCDQKGVALRLVWDESIPKGLLGDPVRLQQIFNNLVGNAVKFTDAGEIVCQASFLESEKSDVVRVLFSVSDSGIGIEDDKIDYLFGEFTQADESYQRSYQGAGLGLSIVRRLIGLLGGSLVVESEIGVGTTFSFSIPFAVDDCCEITPPLVVAKASEKQLSKQILLVEDESVNQLATKSILEKVGVSVVAVSNGAEAVQEVAHGDYALVLMDIQMPVMDGVEATQKIRNGAAGEGKKEIPIIALTAYAMDGDRESFLEKGMDGYVVKPADISTLMLTINEVLNEQQ